MKHFVCSTEMIKYFTYSVDYKVSNESGVNDTLRDKEENGRGESQGRFIQRAKKSTEVFNYNN